MLAFYIQIPVSMVVGEAGLIGGAIGALVLYCCCGWCCNDSTNYIKNTVGLKKVFKNMNKAIKARPRVF